MAAPGDAAISETEPTAEPAPPAGRVGVVDIGSNTVRLVVYEAPMRLPIPVFNEKAQCALGRGIASTGKLNPEGVKEALRSIRRFVRLAAAMGVDRLEMVATAAVRDARDGVAFTRQVERACELPVHVLSGAEEARLAAVGLLSGVADADGILGDLGGGSLDLVGLDHGTIGEYATLPLGHLRLAEDSGGDLKKARQILDNQLGSVPWLNDMGGRAIYAVGGSWRALARVLIDQTHHPLHVIDNYTIGFFDALRLANLVAGLSPSTLDRLTGVPKNRVETLPFAAMALAALLEIAGPREVVFSGFGMREGQMLELLPEDLRHQDPLISACESRAERTGRFAIRGRELLDWMTPLFASESEDERRLRHAACLLSDIGWSEHPDYRAVHAYHRVLRIPYAGLTHAERVQLAIAVLVRYNGDVDSPMVAPVHNLLDDSELERARIAGLALHLAHTLAGSAPGLLSQTQLKRNKTRLALGLPKDRAVFLGEAVERRLRTLAKAMNLKERIGG